MIPANPLYSNPGVNQIQPAFYHSSRLIMMATP